MSNEKILKAAEFCVTHDECPGCPSFKDDPDTTCAYRLARYIVDTENEPAPAPTGTSPNVKKLHTDNSTFLRICQEALLKVCDRIIEVDGENNAETN